MSDSWFGAMELDDATVLVALQMMAVITTGYAALTK
jgi:hypothetical protein